MNKVLAILFFCSGALLFYAVSVNWLRNGEAPVAVHSAPVDKQKQGSPVNDTEAPAKANVESSTEEAAQTNDDSSDVAPPPPQREMVTTASGLQYTDLVVGKGLSPKKGQRVTAHYTGWLEDGTQFDSSVDRGNPIRFRIGVGNVIKGWDEGLMTMKVGGKRRLIIPSHLGYGARGAGGGTVPPNATLIFDVELLSVE